MLVIGVVARLDKSAPANERVSWTGRLAALVDTWPVLLIFLAVIGSITADCSPHEAASIGTLATGFVAWRSGRLNAKSFHSLHVRHLASHGHDLSDSARCRCDERLPWP